jgi:hypothetical protein
LQTIDLPHQVIRRHDPVEIKGVKELALTALLPPYYRLPRNAASSYGITLREPSQPEFCNTIEG